MLPIHPALKTNTPSTTNMSITPTTTTPISSTTPLKAACGNNTYCYKVDIYPVFGQIVSKQVDKDTTDTGVFSTSPLQQKMVIVTDPKSILYTRILILTMQENIDDI